MEVALKGLLCSLTELRTVVRARFNANFNKADGQGASPIIAATFNGHAESIKVLVKNGANPNQLISNGESALIVALNKYQQQLDSSGKSKFKKVIQSLIEVGANPESKTFFGSAYEMAKNDESLVREMKSERKKYLERPGTVLEICESDQILDKSKNDCSNSR